MRARIWPYLAIITGVLNLAIYFWARSAGVATSGSVAYVVIGVGCMASGACVLRGRARRRR